MSKPTVTHVPGPTEKQPKGAAQHDGKKKSAVDLLGLQLTFAKLLEGLCEEVWRSTPSHSWYKMGDVRDDIRKLRIELEELVAARDADRESGK